MAKTLKELREEALGCQNCTLWANATQTVFDAGDPHARVMLVGEQPGDEEDKEGLPFVGPAGRLLDKALTEAGVDREHLYVTNAVKSVAKTYGARWLSTNWPRCVETLKFNPIASPRCRPSARTHISAAGAAPSCTGARCWRGRRRAR